MCCKINVNQSYEKMRDLSPRFRNNLRQYLDLSLHGDAEEGDEVHDEDRPEHRDVENLEKGTAESYHLGLTVIISRMIMKEMMVMIMKVTVALVAEYQNLNSGKRLERTCMKF